MGANQDRCPNLTDHEKGDNNQVAVIRHGPSTFRPAPVISILVTMSRRSRWSQKTRAGVGEPFPAGFTKNSSMFLQAPRSRNSSLLNSQIYVDD